MANVGYYSMTAGQGAAFQVNEITETGDTAINVTVPNAAGLAGLDSLYVVNPSNSNFGTEYMANMSAISAAVSGGMTLMIFDRYVTNAHTILPGGAAITTLRNFSDATNVNVAAGAPAAFANGAHGTIDDSTFDGGDYSTHGYAQLSSLPPGAVPLLTTGDPNHVVAFSYLYGGGHVFYSTIPLDFYSSWANPAITPAEINTLFGNLLDILCFTRGVRIDTPEGPRRVEDLRAGDRVLVRDGTAKPIRWIASTRCGPEDLARNPRLLPVRIAAGALGADLPRRDLLVSRQHRILLRSKVAGRMFGQDEVLVAAVRLTCMPGVAVDEEVGEVEYFHLLLGQHELIRAEGALTESMFAGREALQSVPAEAREELLGLFPELAEGECPPAAAYIPERVRQIRLLERHAKNGLGLAVP